MALKKSKELASGVTGEYWKVSTVRNDFVVGKAQVTLALYKDKAARDAGKEPLAREVVMLASADVDGARTAVYTAIKAQSAFQGSEDA